MSFQPGEKWDDPEDSCREKTCDGDGNIVTNDKDKPDFCEAIYEECKVHYTFVHPKFKFIEVHFLLLIYPGKIEATPKL